MKTHRGTALIIGVAAVLTLALPLTGWAADYLRPVRTGDRGRTLFQLGYRSDSFRRLL